MRVIKKALRILGILFLVAIIPLGIYYFEGKDYLAGNVHHYLGTSTVTEGQVVDLGTELTIGGVYGQVSSLEILEDESIQVEYEFYSEESYPFLTIAKFSYFDTPMIYNFIQEKVMYLSMIGAIIFFIGVFWLCNKHWSKISTSRTERKLLNFLWHLVHPKYILKAPKAISQYSPQVQVPLNIDLDDQGILCVRTWKYKDGFLYSTGIGQACWETKTLLANKNPEDNNENGVYAIRLGVINERSEFIKDIIGIVSLKGEWYEHADGVLRAERCDIVHLLVSEYHRPISSRLSAVYGLPVTVVDNPTNTYLDWLLKENGFDCMVHNSKVMEKTHGNKRTSEKER